MKVFAALFVICAAVASVAAGGYGGGSSGGSSYGGASIPAPPCPKNYLFSCQPSLSPAPCSQPAASYGSAGAYSENVPNYVNVPVGVGGVQGYQGYQGYQGGYQGVQGVQGIQY